jgi:hypothetical protein
VLETETGIIADIPRGVDRPPGSFDRAGLSGFDAAREALRPTRQDEITPAVFLTSKLLAKPRQTFAEIRPRHARLLVRQTQYLVDR